jgi:Protein of unknown function (DUF3052)
MLKHYVIETGVVNLPEKVYSHRDIVDKLGIKPGHIVAFDDVAWELDRELRRKILARAGEAHLPDKNDADATLIRPGTSHLAEHGEVDTVLVAIDDQTDAVEVLRRWKRCLRPAGGIWLLTPKRGQRGYIDQNELIPIGPEAGLVDNKTCSVSDTVRGIRFVIRRRDRPCSKATG